MSKVTVHDTCVSSRLRREGPVGLGASELLKGLQGWFGKVFGWFGGGGQLFFCSLV